MLLEATNVILSKTEDEKTNTIGKVRESYRDLSRENGGEERVHFEDHFSIHH